MCELDAAGGTVNICENSPEINVVHKMFMPDILRTRTPMASVDPFEMT